ncbi:hypothetical protein [Cytobacillus sp. NCCP-133]|uniref:hypothetical protein n=1 Tax=Cytobacillus sp. NCCP-133 TaxID=766848 RepID=UPI0022322BB7|nr:hypothetical protein [Cytobacillus sp. NCCP-133]GLB61416.1 hypothetical protein NCCP133_35460 [Cytobacillus sp. NCCP-133]
MKKKIALVSSFALASLVVVGQFAYAEKSENDMNMMNGNGMANMMNMMNGKGMEKMMESMNSPEGQKMMKACGEFMETNAPKNN